MSVSDDPGRKSPLTYALKESLDAMMRQMMFCLPGRIIAFDPDTQLAQIECGIQRMVSGQGVTIPVIENIPVCFAGDNEWYFWHQITPGETEGLVHFSQRAIDTWIDQGGPVAPHENRMLAEDDAFFVPGIRSRPGAIPNFKNDGAGFGNYAQDNFVHFKADGSVEMEVTGDVSETVGGDVTAAIDGSVTANVGGSVDITTGEDSTFNGATITTDGDVITASGISLDNHVHSQGSDSDGNGEVDTDPPK